MRIWVAHRTSESPVVPRILLEARVLVAVEDHVPLVGAEQRQAEMEERAPPAVLVHMPQLVLIQCLALGDGHGTVVSGRRDRIRQRLPCRMLLVFTVDEDYVAERDSEQALERAE